MEKKKPDAPDPRKKNIRFILSNRGMKGDQNMDSFFTDHFGILLERAERLRRISTRGEYRLAEHDLKTINELRSTMIAFEKRLGEAEKSVRKGICNYLLREDKKRGMKLHGYDLSPGRKQRAGEEREIGNGF